MRDLAREGSRGETGGCGSGDRKQIMGDSTSSSFPVLRAEVMYGCLVKFAVKCGREDLSQRLFNAASDKPQAIVGRGNGELLFARYITCLNLICSFFFFFFFFFF